MLPNTHKSKITVYDLNERLLLSKGITSDSFTFDLKQYEAGIYLLKIKSKHGETVKRVIHIQRTAFQTLLLVYIKYKLIFAPL